MDDVTDISQWIINKARLMYSEQVVFIIRHTLLALSLLEPRRWRRTVVSATATTATATNEHLDLTVGTSAVYILDRACRIGRVQDLGNASRIIQTRGGVLIRCTGVKALN